MKTKKIIKNLKLSNQYLYRENNRHEAVLKAHSSRLDALEEKIAGLGCVRTKDTQAEELDPVKPISDAGIQRLNFLRQAYAVKRNTVSGE